MKQTWKIGCITHKTDFVVTPPITSYDSKDEAADEANRLNEMESADSPVEYYVYQQVFIVFCRRTDKEGLGAFVAVFGAEKYAENRCKKLNTPQTEEQCLQYTYEAVEMNDGNAGPKLFTDKYYRANFG